MVKLVAIFYDNGLMKVSTTNDRLLESCFKVWSIFVRKRIGINVKMPSKDGSMS
jgi:hypothetical protein